MMKELDGYKTIIVDMDGTLYYQRPVRLAMMLEMAMHFWRLHDFLIVKRYRELYEQGYNQQQRLELLGDGTDSIIQEWMIMRPLKYIKKNYDKRLVKMLQDLSSYGYTVIVYSDYPVKEKLNAINYKPDYAFDSDSVDCMKPDSRGLVKKLDEIGIDIANCVVIGDRQDKDGELASNLGAKCYILAGSKKERILWYKNSSIEKRFT